MTTEELIKILQTLPQDKEVIITGLYGASAQIDGERYVFFGEDDDAVFISTDLCTG